MLLSSIKKAAKSFEEVFIFKPLKYILAETSFATTILSDVTSTFSAFETVIFLEESIVRTPVSAGYV